ncbi:hypothetical protein M409DRAFT_71445 [Zasmidium cellare ATCC 36951]|uniref:Major facilitator superfamily (MFS) profile domain-containing protein n=1 Tax=Zasmidium cellare ATCC 36951 TaxID=1080233 RepID=A0A6A6BVH9_ZASCE|nr:uncharacterized protein M409DRAFT_71445 [Zasmidium cellare ATCC 36951]KAF2158814.1 hypothetical protein M409DRAFT_71445 [Zasmidium cellare ATCC 36951]
MWSLTKLEGTSLNIAITCASGAGFMLFGYDQGFFGGILTNTAFLNEFNNPGATMRGQIVALYDVGCMMGCLVSMYYGDMLGRKPETAEASRRGALIVFQLVMNIGGISLTNWMNYGFTFIPGTEVSWRFPIAFQIFFALVTVSLVWFLPESPRWLVQRGRTDEASVIIARLRAKPTHDPNVLAEIQMLDAAVALEMEEQHGVTVKEIFSGGKQQTLRRILLGMGTQFMQQMGGTNVVATYLPVVLTASFSLSARVALIVSATVSIWLMIWGAMCALVIDSVGRRKLMLYGAAAESICFALIAAGLAVNTNPTLIMAIAFIYLYYTAYGLSFLSIPFIYPAEINSQRMRNTGTSWSTMTNWALAYLVISVTPVGIQNIGWKYYLIYAITNAVFVPLVYFFYVETKKPSLE